MTKAELVLNNPSRTIFIYHFHIIWIISNPQGDTWKLTKISTETELMHPPWSIYMTNDKFHEFDLTYVIRNQKKSHKSLFLMLWPWLWHMILKSYLMRGTITTNISAKIESNPSSAFWVIVSQFKWWAVGGFNMETLYSLILQIQGI